MQTVSQAWIAAQQQTLVPESFVEVSLTVGDPDAQAEAAVTSNGELYFSDAAAVTGSAEQSPEKYATLEQNIWSLDGALQFFRRPPHSRSLFLKSSPVLSPG